MSFPCTLYPIQCMIIPIVSLFIKNFLKVNEGGSTERDEKSANAWTHQHIKVWKKRNI